MWSTQGGEISMEKKRIIRMVVGKNRRELPNNGNDSVLHCFIKRKGTPPRLPRKDKVFVEYFRRGKVIKNKFYTCFQYNF